MVGLKNNHIHTNLTKQWWNPEGTQKKKKFPTKILLMLTSWTAVYYHANKTKENKTKQDNQKNRGHHPVFEHKHVEIHTIFENLTCLIHNTLVSCCWFQFSAHIHNEIGKQGLSVNLLLKKKEIVCVCLVIPNCSKSSVFMNLVHTTPFLSSLNLCTKSNKVTKQMSTEPVNSTMIPASFCACLTWSLASLSSQ